MSLYGQVYSVALIAAQLFGQLNTTSLSNKQKKILNVGEPYQIVAEFKTKAQSNVPADPFVVNGDISFGVAGSNQKNLFGYNSSKLIDYLVGFAATDIQHAPVTLIRKLIKTDRPPVAQAAIFFTDDLANFKQGSLTVTAVQNTATGTAVTVFANFAFDSVIRATTTTLYETREGIVDIVWQSTEGSAIQFAIESTLTFGFSVSVNATWANPAGGVSTTVVIPAYSGTPPITSVVGNLTNIAKPIDKINIALYSTDTSTAFSQRILDVLF